MKHTSSSGFVIAIVVLVVVAILAIAVSGQGFVPYDPSTIYTNRAPFEGFANHVNYSTYPNNASIDQMVTRNINDTPVQYPYPLWSMGGLFPQASANPSKIDAFGGVQGSLSEQCQNASNGLSNSKGYLCLNQSQLNLLTTRGGNQTGCGSQKGPSCGCGK
jgi:hypothetical protein